MVLLALGALWLQLFLALIPVWRFGQYYDYGWLVPPVAIVFVLRRRSMGLLGVPELSSSSRLLSWWAVGAGTLGMAGFLAALRIVELANSDWRPPLIFHASFVVVISHCFVWKAWSRRASLALLPVTIFALSAVPYPGRAETVLISELTGNVIRATTELFHLSGLPVEQVGDKLALNDEMVEVTEGCSGIRSLQSLVMAGLFFGEFLLLGWRGRVTLLGVSVVCALVLNVARAYWLARTQFTEGKAAAMAVHDIAGHLAFGISAAVLFLAASLMRRPRGMKTVVVMKGRPGTP